MVYECEFVKMFNNMHSLTKLPTIAVFVGCCLFFSFYLLNNPWNWNAALLRREKAHNGKRRGAAIIFFFASK